MSDSPPQKITQLLLAWRHGDQTALDQLMPLVYQELRRLAHRFMKEERPGRLLQSTALVNEAYLRLIDSSRVEWEGRAHFFAVAAQMMRRVLVDAARERRSRKRGGAALVAAPQPSMIGERLGHYRILSLLGRGGMGEVYLGEDTLLKRKVALKLLPAAFTSDRERLRRFEEEARTASALNHPNIITIHEIGQYNDVHYLVTEHIESETLRQRIQREPVSLSSALDIAVQVASALAAAHAAGITHRDIKPENVMVRPDGLVKVLDFGLAKLEEWPAVTPESKAPPAGRLSTAPGMLMGTVSYMSPEQARGLKVDYRTDMFRLGVMLYELVAGRRPFEGATASDVIAEILDIPGAWLGGGNNRSFLQRLADLGHRAQPPALRRPAPADEGPTVSGFTRAALIEPGR